ncbi:NAD(P)-dependent oxidoreductase [bacterium]|nr:NAD(P)-dependent oxidoreductase [bacterium]
MATLDRPAASPFFKGGLVMSAGKRILITGGAGSCGVFLTESLLERGYKVTVLDRDVEPLGSLEKGNLTLIQGLLGDRDTVKKAVEGVDAVIHLAWSFSSDPMEVLEQDLKGHINLLEEMSEQKTGHLIYTSTAVVYGKPRYSPIDEDHPLVVEEARKPLYGITKAAAEKLCLLYWKERGLPATVIRFWWAYGDDIGGRHLRKMLQTAADGEPLEFPGESGGSFLHLADLYQGVEKCLFTPAAYGQTFNMATVYVTWNEVAEIVKDVTGSASEIKSIPTSEWRGSAFLADPWELDDNLARQLVGYTPTDDVEAKALLKSAIARRWESMKSS